MFLNGGFLYRNSKVSNKNGCSLRTFATLQIIKDSPIYFFRAKKKNFCNEYYVIASYYFTLFVYFLVFVLKCKIVVYLSKSKEDFKLQKLKFL